MPEMFSIIAHVSNELNSARGDVVLKNKTRFPLSLVGAVALAVILAVSACSGSDTFEGNGAKLDVSPTEDGFAFANFGERDTDEYLNGADLALMFGASACVDEVTDPCRPIAEAAAWAQTPAAMWRISAASALRPPSTSQFQPPYCCTAQACSRSSMLNTSR